MKILVVGTGGVGAAVAAVAVRRSFFERLTLADLDPARPRRLVASLDDERLRAAAVDASDREALVHLIGDSGADAVLNATDPRFNPQIFAAAAATGVTYLDLAMTLSRPDPERPYERPGVKLGDEQFAEHDAWAAREQLALVGMGVEPGLSDVFARYAADQLFETIDEVAVRDGANLEVDGYEFAPTWPSTGTRRSSSRRP
jgi:saccharopine dehydrogenase-like NADP-dependent oxidoreductase